MKKYGKAYYQAFLMRFWKEQAANERHLEVWRFTLEDSHSGERMGFASLEAFITFMKEQTTEGQRQP